MKAERTNDEKILVKLDRVITLLEDLFILEASRIGMNKAALRETLRIVTLEGIRPSRNLVGHMNFPNAYHRNAIDGAYKQLPNLVARLSGQNIPIAIP